MKILRLSLFNLKKNKREAFSVMFLTAISMLLMGISVCNITKVNTVFDQMFEATGSVQNMVMFPAERYRQVYKEILEEDDRVSRVEEIDALHTIRASYKKEDAEIGATFVFVTENSEKKIEKFVPVTNLAENEIGDFSHPIWLPTYFQYSQKFEAGSDFIVVLGGREYPFEIAGFYESGLMGNMNIGLKCIISEGDYQLLSAVMDEKKIIAYDGEEYLSAIEYMEKCSEQSSENIRSYCFLWNKEEEKANTTMFITLYLEFLIAAAFITMMSCLFMIRHKISNDIEEQMQSIGVLEALGYKSKEISFTYIYEYVLTSGVGAVAGIFLAILSEPVLNDIIEGMIGYRVYGSANLGKQIGIMLVLILINVFSALGKAKTVKKYPPVVAFRKGIYTHYFGKNYLPLTGLKGNINLRLSMKDLFGNTKHSIGMMICIFATATAILCSFYIFDYLKAGAASIMPITGMEVGDVRVELMNGVDPYEFQKTMLELPEVKKTLVTYPDFMVYSKKKSANSSFFNGLAVIFDDFKETENINLIEGRYPEHDNEIMITFGTAKKEGYSLGDSIVIEGEGIERSYIITGIVNSMSNGGYNLYFTSEGFRCSFPSARACVVEIYLKEDVDRHEYIEKLTALYGSSVEDTVKSGGVNDSYTDRIKQTADEKMAKLISLYGVTDVDYAVKIGDTVITGNSERFIIRDISSTIDLAEGQLEPVAVGMKTIAVVIVCFSVIVAAVILSVLAGTTVRRKRKELGIMKAMGYTSKDLMQQIAFRMMPIACAAVIIASVISVYLINAFGFTMFAVVLDVNYWIIFPIDICFLLFCYLVTYISAGRIKQISVTELMAE